MSSGDGDVVGRRKRMRGGYTRQQVDDAISWQFQRETVSLLDYSGHSIDFHIKNVLVLPGNVQ